MAKKYLDGDGLLYLWQKITNQFVKKDGSKVLSTNDYTTDEKNKLAGIEAGATKTVVDTELSATSTNPVQNKVINTALAGKVNTVSGKGLSTNDLTDDLLTKINNTATKVEEIATIGGEPNIIETVKVNGEILDVTDKTVDIVIPESDQADWSQNDETAASYVKNRPFYEASKTTDIISPTKTITIEVTNSVDTIDYAPYYYTTEELERINTLSDGEGVLKLTINGEVFESPVTITNKKFSVNELMVNDIINDLIMVYINESLISFGYVLGIGNYNFDVSLSIVSPGEVVKIPEKFLPDAVVLESELVQPDWNQNDETAPDYVKNRPFYETTATKTLIENKTITLTKGTSDTLYTYTFDENDVITISGPTTSELTWNGKKYTTTSEYNIDTGYWFYRVNADEGEVCIYEDHVAVWYNDVSSVLEEVTIWFTSEIPTVCAIPGKFLPDTVVFEDELTSKNYQNEAQVNTLIANAIGNITGISYEIVTSLPETGEAGVIYLISNNGSNPNIYDEYIYANGSFEKIGTTDVDLSGYVQDSDLVAITNSEIDTLIAG